MSSVLNEYLGRINNSFRLFYQSAPPFAKLKIRIKLAFFLTIIYFKNKYSNKAATENDKTQIRTSGPYTVNAALIIAKRSRNVTATVFFLFLSNSSCSSGVLPSRADIE